MAPQLGDLRLSVRYDEGSGPLVVLLHGINNDARSWREVIDEIGTGYRVIAPDLLGFGESPKPTDVDYSADDQAEVLEATLRDLGVTERFLLVGYSMGGNVAVRYAATHPERLRRLFLLSAPFYLPPEAYSRQTFGWQYTQARFFQWVWRFVGRQKERDGVLYGVISGPLEKPLNTFLRTEDLSAHWDIMQKALENTVSAATFVDDLPKLTMPTTFALGIRDPLVRPDQTMALKRIKPTLEVRRIVGLSADHMLLDNAPARVAHEILADEAGALHVSWHHGSGEPVVLLPGLSDDGSGWQPVADALVAGAQEVAVLDLLGFGASPRPLSSLYTIEDQVSAVWATVDELFGDRPVALAGRGLGATVALACAAAAPERVTTVVAFSPVLPDPEASAGQLADPALAPVMAIRETFEALVRDERAQRYSGPRLEADVVPTVRTVDALLAVDSAALLDRQQRPAQLVLPSQDPATPRAWLEREVTRRTDSHLTALAVAGGFDFPYRHPQTAAALIRGVPVPGEETPIPWSPPAGGIGGLRSRLLGGVQSQFTRHGLLALLGGLLLLLMPVQIPISVVFWGFAIWLLVEAVQTIAGAVGLRREGRPWLGWLLVGLVSVPFAVLLALRESVAISILIWAVAGWAVVRAGSALFAAWRAPQLRGRRWLLVGEALLAVAVAVALLFVPHAAGALLRWILGAYLTASGIMTLGLAWATHRDTLRRVRELAD